MTINERVSDLIHSEIADFFAGFGSPGEPEIQNGDAQRQLSARIDAILQQYRAAAEQPVAWKSTAQQFVKKPVTISAVQWTGDNLPDVIDFTGKHPRWHEWFSDMDEYVSHVRADGNKFKIFTLEGVIDALPGDWIIRGVQGEHYPCKPDIFAATYEPAAPAVQAEQLSGNTEQVSQPVLPENSPCVDAPNHIWLQTAGDWPASGEFSELTWSCDNQYPDDTLYVRADLVGSSPVIPDGWQLVPKEATPEMLNASWVSHGVYHPSAYRTMLAAAPAAPAAPKQEVKS